MKITVIGESNIDIAVKPYGDPRQGGCTPADIAFHHGGVGRNIAHNLCLLGHEVRLMSVFGGDDFAQGLLADCKKTGIDLSLSTVFAKEKSPIFLSFNDKIGNVQSAASDVGLNDHMDLTWLRPKMDDINRSDWVVANTILTASALSYLIDHCDVPLFVDTVSPGKARRFSEALESSHKHSVFALKCNVAEACSLTGETRPELSAKQLNVKGINHVFVTLGSNGVIHCTENELFPYDALPVNVVNVAGSGDAFLSGVVHAYAIGQQGDAVVRLGLEMARKTTETEALVNEKAVL